MTLRLLTASLRRRLRQLVLILAAVVLAAATVSALVSFSLRVRGGLGDELAAFGPNLVVRPQVGGPERLPAAEAERIRSLPGVEAAVGIVESEAGGEQAGAAVPPGLPAGLPLLAVEPSLLAVHPGWKLIGDWPQPGQVLLGAEAAGLAPALASGTTVAGVLSTGGPLDRAVFLPLEALASERGGRPGVERVEVRVPRERLEEVMATIEEEVAGAEARPLLEVSASESALVDRLTRLLQAFTGISLLLALISVAAATAALVEERRKEVGLFLALGYTGRRVAGIFAAELLAAALLAGLAGELLGEVAARRMAVSVLGATVSSPLATTAGMMAAALAAVLVVAAAMTLTLHRFERLDAARVLRGE